MYWVRPGVKLKPCSLDRHQSSSFDDWNVIFWSTNVGIRIKHSLTPKSARGISAAFGDGQGGPSPLQHVVHTCFKTSVPRLVYLQKATEPSFDGRLHQDCHQAHTRGQSYFESRPLKLRISSSSSASSPPPSSTFGVPHPSSLTH